MPAGLNVPGSAKIGTNYTTAKNLTQLTADTDFAGTVYLTAPVIPTANRTLTCDLKPVRGAIITLGSHNLAISSPSCGTLSLLRSEWVGRCDFRGKCAKNCSSMVGRFSNSSHRRHASGWDIPPVSASSRSVLSDIECDCSVSNED